MNRLMHKVSQQIILASLRSKLPLISKEVNYEELVVLLWWIKTQEDHISILKKQSAFNKNHAIKSQTLTKIREKPIIMTIS